MNKAALNTALAAILGFAAIGAQAAVLNYGDQLIIIDGCIGNSCDLEFSGSYFAMDSNGNSKISIIEKVPLSMGTTGIIVGQATAPGASHSGYPTIGDSNAIDAPWGFFGNTGSDYTTIGITGSTTAGLNMSGWTVTWNGIASIPMGTGAWATGTGTGHTGATGTFANGVANFYWSGVYGTAYTLNYRATVPLGDPSGFGGVRYELHLEGIVNASTVPVPAAVWLFGSGLLGLLGTLRRKRSLSGYSWKVLQATIHNGVTSVQTDCPGHHQSEIRSSLSHETGRIITMHTKKTVLATTLASVLGICAFDTQAAVVNAGDMLSIVSSSTTSGTWVSGSYFAMDTNGNLKIVAAEKLPLTNGSTGLVIGTTTSAGASHAGAPTAGDTNAIDAPWAFFGNTGSDYLTTGVTGSTTAGLNFSGWTVTWNGITSIPMGTGAWVTGTGAGHSGATGTFANGVANFYWSGVYGTAYSLDYRATVPLYDPSGFGEVKYELHLEGIVNEAPAVPVPAAAWLFGSGLFGLLGMARRKLV